MVEIRIFGVKIIFISYKEGNSQCLLKMMIETLRQDIMIQVYLDFYENTASTSFILFQKISKSFINFFYCILKTMQ